MDIHLQIKHRCISWSLDTTKQMFTSCIAAIVGAATNTTIGAKSPVLNTLIACKVSCYILKLNM